MNESRYTNRRTVLKTLGASVVGGAVLTGSAVADSIDKTIELKGHQFVPRNASVSLGSDDKAKVEWFNNEVEYFGQDAHVPHDVHLHHDGHLVQSSDNGTLKHPDTYLLPGDSYVVKFEEDGNNLEVKEVSDDSKQSERQEATITEWGVV